MPREIPIDRPSAWRRVRRAVQEFLWVPTAIMAGFVALSVVVIWLDRSPPGWLEPLRGVLAAHVFQEAESTRAFVGLMTTGLITVASITFSMLLLALQQSASMVGAQVVYSFLLRRRNQVLLGFILAAALFVLATRAGASNGFAPVLGASVSLVLTAAALYSLAVLLFMAVNQMRPQVVLSEVRTVTLEARRRQRDLLLATYRSSRYEGGTEVSVRTEEHGYVRDVDVAVLREGLRSREGEVEVEICAEIGEFVGYGDELARVRAARPSEAERLAGVVREAMVLDYQRAVERDPSFGVQQIHMAGWSSGSTANHNPGVAFDAVRNLRDILGRWSATYAEVEASDGTLPVVYPDGLVERVIEALEALALVSTESLQSATFEEVLHAYRLSFGALPARMQDRVATSLGRLVTGLGDLLLTPQLERALEGMASALRAAGHTDAAATVETATRQMASASGQLAARSTRVKEATSNGSGSG